MISRFTNPSASQGTSLARASINLFDLLGIKLSSLRTEEKCDIPVAVLSNDLWKQRFASDPI